MEYTKGPWTVGATPHYLRMGQEGIPLTIRCPHHTEEIATVWTCCLPTEANAQLIACAPELLEALEGIMRIKNLLGADDEYYNLPEHYEEGQAVYSALQKIELVIAKAKSR